MKIVVSKGADELSVKAAAEFVAIAEDSIRQRGSFNVALSGGSTPLLLYRRLVEAAVEWDRVSFYFGDERNVPPDEDASNFKGANKELFRPLRIREDKIHRWRTELETPDAVADDYEQVLRRLSTDAPRFDLVLLGMGADGHTASLFPGTKGVDETERSAIANWVPQLGMWRFTLTFTAFNHARNLMFLVTGSDKADTLRSVIEGEPRPDTLPAQRIVPADGTLSWFVDQAAASKLSDVNI